MVPDHLILDTGAIIRRFRQRISALPLAIDVDEHEIAGYMFEYLNSADEAMSNIREYAIEMCEVFHQQNTDITMEKFMCALLDMGHDFIQLLNELKAYDERGIFWYSCTRFAMDCAIMERVSKEAFIN